MSLAHKTFDKDAAIRLHHLTEELLSRVRDNGALLTPSTDG
jgi:hypothetical protein